jgi:hypothetical protein
MWPEGNLPVDRKRNEEQREPEQSGRTEGEHRSNLNFG